MTVAPDLHLAGCLGRQHLGGDGGGKLHALACVRLADAVDRVQDAHAHVNGCLLSERRQHQLGAAIHLVGRSTLEQALVQPGCLAGIHLRRGRIRASA